MNNQYIEVYTRAIDRMNYLPILLEEKKKEDKRIQLTRELLYLTNKRIALAEDMKMALKGTIKSEIEQPTKLEDIKTTSKSLEQQIQKVKENQSSSAQANAQAKKKAMEDAKQELEKITFFVQELITEKSKQLQEIQKQREQESKRVSLQSQSVPKPFVTNHIAYTIAQQAQSLGVSLAPFATVCKDFYDAAKTFQNSTNEDERNKMIDNLATFLYTILGEYGFDITFSFIDQEERKDVHILTRRKFTSDYGRYVNLNGLFADQQENQDNWSDFGSYVTGGDLYDSEELYITVQCNNNSKTFHQFDFSEIKQYAPHQVITALSKRKSSTLTDEDVKIIEVYEKAVTSEQALLKEAVSYIFNKILIKPHRFFIWSCVSGEESVIIDELVDSLEGLTAQTQASDSKVILYSHILNQNENKQ